MSKEKRFVIQVDPLEIEDDAIFDNKELRLYKCQSDMMSDICSLLNQQDQRIAELKAENEILQQQLKDNTKQVCEKIRKEIIYYPVSQLTEAGKIKANVWGISMKDIEKILDQIENEKEDVFDE